MLIGETMVDVSKSAVADKRTTLPSYKVELIESLISSGALKTGDYKPKSGRDSPYMINVGDLNSGAQTRVLAQAYSSIISRELGNEFDMIYGIPEKGVSLAAPISMQLSAKHKKETNWFFTRKVEKTYGEVTGSSKEQMAKRKVVGKIPESGSRIVLIDDVFTTGEAKYDTVNELGKLLDNPKIVALVIAVDRQETDVHGKSAIKEFTEKTGIPVYSILKATEILQYLNTSKEPDAVGINKIGAYLRAFGTKEASSQIRLKSEMPLVVSAERSIIPACDMSDIKEFERLVQETSKVEGIGGYKIGFELGLLHGLPKVVEVARKHTDKPLIYDHQKAGTDIPDTGKKFMQTLKTSGIDSVILFPQSGPKQKGHGCTVRLKTPLAL